MNLKSRITTTRASVGALALTLTLAVTLFLPATPVFAHGGFDHVSGTVVKIVDKVLTVKTTKGNVDVKLDDKTELTKNDQKALLTDLKPGVRVIVDIPEGSKDKIAHSVKIGVAAATGHDASK
jgi:hypothetical protein